MSNSCGIDLGTTNSCIAIVEEGEPKVVCDKHGRVTVPSVVHQDRQGNLFVGYAAKARLGQMPPPVITVKRKMGTDEKVRLGEQERSATEVSRMILEYLRQMGEEEAQSALENVVVTVPAYFNFKQKQDTETAAREAGFKEVMVLQEPVAAALAYCVEAGDRPMIVLAYDLGGGTFDATVLERTADQEINVLAFGGDPWLGGDDFDSLLAEDLRRRLKARNYAVDWDLQRVEHYAKFQRLKEQAEDLKKRLSTVREAAVNFPQVFKDEDGVLVDLEEVVSRETLYELIGAKLERSIELTHETLARSRVPIERLSKLIMVGGSSYIPRIQERLQQSFGLRPELVDHPETIVAVGAAIKAAVSFGIRISGKGIAVNLDYQPRTARPQARISGRLSQPVAGWVARLLRGEFESTVDLKGDRFRFDQVPLTEGETNEFSLTLEDEEGEERLYADLPIQQDATAMNLRTPEALVAKLLRVRLADRFDIVLEAGAQLPTRVTRVFLTLDQSGEIRVPIYEGSVPITELRLDVPRGLPIGSEVEVDLTFNKDYRVHARARVREGGQEAQVQFEIPPIQVPTAAEVQARLKDIAKRWAGATAVTGPIDETKYQASRQVIESELAAPEPKMAKIAEDLGELESLLVPVETRAGEQQLLQPPLDEVERRLGEAEKNAEDKAKAGSFDLKQFRAHITELQGRARDCWERRDVAGWRQVVSLLTGLEGIAKPVFDLEQKLREMSDQEVQDLAVGLAQWIVSEVQTKPAARQLLGRIDLEKLLYAAVNEPRAAALTGVRLLSQLVQAGVTELPGGEDAPPRQGKAQKPSTEFILKGLLGSVKR